MAECCGCVETHNGLRTLSVRKDLASNPLTGRIPATGMVKIISAAVNNNYCDPSANVRPMPELRAWGTHVQSVGTASAPSYRVTETEFSDSALRLATPVPSANCGSRCDPPELVNLQAQCAFIHILGSGSGICSCGTGD